MKLLNTLGKISKNMEHFYSLSYRNALKSEKKNLDDFFMIIVFSEMMGVENPFAFYTLEMLPELMDKFHIWHKKVGLNHSPFENFPCAG